MRDYDPEEVQPDGAGVATGLVERAVEVSTGVDGVRALREGGSEFTVESVVMYPLFDERCVVEPGEAMPEDCVPLAQPLDDLRRLREQDAHGAEVRLRLAGAATAPEGLVVACPQLTEGMDIDRLLVHAFVYGAEEPREDSGYLFLVEADGESVGCGPARRAGGDGGRGKPDVHEPVEREIP